MNITHPLKYHYYSYRRFYLIYFFLYFTFLMASILSFRHLDNFYKYLSSSLLLITFAFTIVNSVYEFTLLIFHYLKLKTIKIEFFISSIIYSIINAIIQISLVFIAYKIIEIFYKDINNVLLFNQLSIYLFTFFVHLSLFSIIGIISLILKNIKFVQILLYSVLLLIVALISFEITVSIIDFVQDLYLNQSVIINLTPLVLIITILVWILIYIKTNSINN